MIVPRRMKLPTARSCPSACTSIRSRWTGPTSRRARSKRFQSMWVSSPGELMRGLETPHRPPTTISIGRVPTEDRGRKSTIKTGDQDQPPPAAARPTVPGRVGPAAPGWFPATIVHVHDDSGPCRDRVGRRPCTALPGTKNYFLGQDPLDHERHAAALANIDFHAGRPWPLDVALWDLAGQIEGPAVWSPRRRSSRRIRAYASPVASTARSPTWWMVARQARALGFPALKVCLGRPSLDADLAVVRAHPRRHRQRPRADGRLQPGLADAVGHTARRGTSSGRRTVAPGVGRRAAGVDRGTAASRRLRRP